VRKAGPHLTETNEGGWLILAAWRPELAHLRASLPGLPVRARRKVTLAAVGVGLVEAGIGATRLLVEQRPAAVLLVGTAGVYPGNRGTLPLGVAAVIDKIRLLPVLLPGNHAYLPAIVPARARSSPALVRALCKTAGLPRAAAACPLAITASPRAAAAAAKISGCALENLESFAVARAAAAAGVPFAAILGIANHVGPQGHREWKLNAARAAAAACDAVLAMLGK
jgi:futalosine hydrolase